MRAGRRDTSPNGIMPPMSSSSVREDQNCRKATEAPQLRELVVSQLSVASNACNYAIAAVALRTANDSITRVTPLMIMLTPTNVPIAQTELDGHRI